MLQVRGFIYRRSISWAGGGISARGGGIEHVWSFVGGVDDRGRCPEIEFPSFYDWLSLTVLESRIVHSMQFGSLVAHCLEPFLVGDMTPRTASLTLHHGSSEGRS